MLDPTRDVGDYPFSIRNARWRTWLRVHTPNVLYYRLGLVVPKARDCGRHDWHNSGGGLDGCYHCDVTRPRPPTDSIPEGIAAWFLERGYTLLVAQIDDIFWADLVNAQNRVVAPRYGRGANAAEAADRAMRRYLEEQ